MGDMVGEGAGTAGSGYLFEGSASTSEGMIAGIVSRHNNDWLSFVQDFYPAPSDREVRLQKLALITNAAEHLLSSVGVSHTIFETEVTGKPLETFAQRYESRSDDISLRHVSKPIGLDRFTIEGPHGPATLRHHATIESAIVGRMKWRALILGKTALKQETDSPRLESHDFYAIRRYVGDRAGKMLIPMDVAEMGLYIPVGVDVPDEKLTVMSNTVSELAVAAGVVLKAPEVI